MSRFELFKHRLRIWIPNYFIGVSLIVSLIYFFPAFYYQHLYPAITESENEIVRQINDWLPTLFHSEDSFAEDARQQVVYSTQEGQAPAPVADDNSTVSNNSEEEITQEEYLPAPDPSLPEGDWLRIGKIGVMAQLHKTQLAHQALAVGVWWVPDFGSPGDKELPMILASHRFGYSWWWNSDHGKLNSFYHLPELEVGDQVEVISQQRLWKYEIYASSEGLEIDDYSADLILYTCKHLNSPIRFFRYARVIVE